MRSSWCSLLLLLVTAVTSSASYKTLVVFPMGPRSEFYLMSIISTVLGDAGHDVTYISTHEWSHQHPNVTYINLGSNDFSKLNLFKMQEVDDALNSLSTVFASCAEQLWTNDQVKQIWEDRNTFDVIIFIGTWNEIATPFLLDYNGVFILVCTAGVEIFQTGHYGNWLPLSTTPIMHLPFDESMSFMERSFNLLTAVQTWLLYSNIIFPLTQEAVEPFFPQIPSLQDLYQSSDLMLINGHFAIDGAAPLLPNQVEIGTITIQQPKPLPKDLEEFIEGAGDAGIIYFSIGTTTMGVEMPDHNKKLLVAAFRELGQRVLWKYEGDDLDLPPNVLTSKWLPQQDILAHPKTRLFISHCGILSSQEAKYFGVPVLALPIGYDQPRNAMRMVRKGYGIMLKWEDMTVDAIVEAINTLLTDSSYQKRMDEVSRILHDQKESPQERTVWWVEYAIRNKGTKHLEYAGKNLYYLQYMMVDIVVVWGGLLVLCVALFCCLVVAIFKTCFKRRKNKQKTE